MLKLFKICLLSLSALPGRVFSIPLSLANSHKDSTAHSQKMKVALKSHTN